MPILVIAPTIEYLYDFHYLGHRMLNQDKKLNIYHDQEVMTIDFKWYTPAAFAILFFTIIWNVFLLFWYAMATAGNTPLIFKLFPLLHVAVGIFLIYFTLCQFFNKTNIEIDRELLTIRHSPVPWWKGNVAIATNDINQLYVKETKSRSKNGTNFSYSLRAKLNDHTDKEVLALTGIESAQMQEIEEQLERFIGITDSPVKGEYNSKPAAIATNQLPRRQHRNFTDSPLGLFYFSEKGEFFEFKTKEVKVLSVTQYDWNDGNSDKLLQLSNEDNEELLLFFDQNLAILHSFQEEALSLSAVDSIHFSVTDPPKRIEVAGENFQLGQYKKGKVFISGGAQALAVEQWIYISADQKTNIRVINNNGVMHYYKGRKLNVDDFEDRLDLNDFDNRGIEDIEYRDREWEDDELV